MKVYEPRKVTLHYTYEIGRTGMVYEIPRLNGVYHSVDRWKPYNATCAYVGVLGEELWMSKEEFL